jgi:ribonuclease HII
MPPSISRVARDSILEDHGVTPKSRAFLETGYRTKKENAAIRRDWRELNKIRRRWFKDCRSIRVEVTES